MFASKFTLIGFIVLALTCIGLGTTSYLAVKKIGALNVEIQTHKETISELENTILAMQIAQQEHDANIEQIQQQYRAAKESLDRYRGREETVRAKPGLVDIKAKKASEAAYKELSCVTGALEHC